MRDWLYKTALVLTIIGAINWGLVGLFNLDAIALLFGGVTSAMSRIIFTVVGLAGLTTIGLLFMDYGRQSDDEHERSTVRSTY